jgi:hypothetical protein
VATSTWPLALSWMAAGYNAAQVTAEDLGIRNQPWWTARPVTWFLRNIENLLEPLTLHERTPVR